MATQTRERLTAARRNGVGKKSQLKTLRRSGQIPASLYGHGQPENIQISALSLQQHLQHHGLGALVDLDFEGRPCPTLIREVERDAVTGRILHLGFQRVDLREQVRATIPVVFEGEEDLIKEGWVLERQLSEIEVHGQADQIPEVLTVSIGAAHPGEAIHVGDLPLPRGMTAVREADAVVARISYPVVAADVRAELDAEIEAHAQARLAQATEEDAEVEEAAAT